MDKDIVPELLETIQADFEQLYGTSAVVKRLFEALKAKKATYATVNEFAIEIGKILSKALTGSVSSSNLPDGKMYYNIANRLLNETLGRNFEEIKRFTGEVQKNLNNAAGISLKVQHPKLNQDRIDGMVNRLSSEDSFDSVKWMLGEPIVNFSQSIVDDSIEKNAEFQFKSGLSPEIIRTETGDCCEWCREVVGRYKYPKVPKDVYRRHQRCRCRVDYDPKTGKIQDVWTKKERTISEEVKDRYSKSVEKLFKEQVVGLEKRKLLDLQGRAVQSIEKSNMKQSVGLANFNQFLDKFDTISDRDTLSLYQKFGSKIEYYNLKGVNNFAKGHRVQLSQGAFDGKIAKSVGNYWAKPLSTVFHENGHAIDKLGLDVLTKGKRVVIGEKNVKLYGKTGKVSVFASHASSLPQYKLKQTIQDDLWKYVNDDLPMKRTSAGKAKIDRTVKSNLEKFKNEMLSLHQDNPSAVATLSDITESTDWFKENKPFGYGHGRGYWKNTGATEAEFFAEVSEAVANDPKAYEEIKRILPNAVDVYHKIVKDILGGS